MTTDRVPLASVLIPWRESVGDLLTLIRMLEEQTLGTDSFEVVVCDDGSSREARAQLPQHPWLRVDSAPHRNAYAALNRGVRRARAKVIVTTDADCRPASDWLERGLEALRQADVVAGEIRASVPDPPTIWSLLDIDKFLDQERAVAGGHATTGNLFVRRSLFDLVGGFDEDFSSGGDFNFVSRAVAAGATLVFAPDVVVSHPSKRDAPSFIRKVWRVHYHRSPVRPQLRNAVPIVTPAVGRLTRGLPIGLDLRRLDAQRTRPSTTQRLAAIPLLHVVIPAVELVAPCASWPRTTRITSRIASCRPPSRARAVS